TPIRLATASVAATASPANAQICGSVNVSGVAPDHKPIVPICNLTTSSAMNTGGSSPDARTIVQPLANNSRLAPLATDWVQIPFANRTAVTPPSRNNAAVAYDEARGVIVVFGGRHYDLVDGNWTVSNLGDTWTWDGRS